MQPSEGSGRGAWTGTEDHWTTRTECARRHSSRAALAVSAARKEPPEGGSCFAGVPGLEPRTTEPESVVLPITPYPNGVRAPRSSLRRREPLYRTALPLRKPEPVPQAPPDPRTVP